MSSTPLELAVLKIGSLFSSFVARYLRRCERVDAIPFGSKSLSSINAIASLKSSYLFVVSVITFPASVVSF